MLFFVFPNWLAAGSIPFVQTLVAGYFTYRLCKDHLYLDEWPSIIGGLAYASCFFYFQSGFAGEAGFPFILWSLEYIQRRKRVAGYILAALLGILVLFSSSFALSIPFILIMALAWFVLVRRIHSLRFLSLFGTFCGVLLVGQIPVIWALLVNSPLSHRADWDWGVILGRDLPDALLKWSSGIDAFTVQLTLIALGLGVMVVLVSRFRDRPICMLVTLLCFCLLARFQQTAIQDYTDLGRLSSFQFDRFYLLAPFFGVITTVYVMHHAPEWVAPRSQLGGEAKHRIRVVACLLLLVLAAVGTYSYFRFNYRFVVPFLGFQFDYYYLLVPFSGAIAVAYLMHRVPKQLAVGLELGTEAKHRIRVAACLLVVTLAVSGSVQVKLEHSHYWVRGDRYAAAFDSAEMRYLASLKDDFAFRVATVVPWLGVGQCLRPAYAHAYGLETADGVVTLYSQRYQDFWGKVLEPLASEYESRYRWFQNHGNSVYLWAPGLDTVAGIEFSEYFNLNLLALANTKYLISTVPLLHDGLTPVQAENKGGPTAEEEGLLQRISASLAGRPDIYVYENGLCLPRFFACGSATVFDSTHELLQGMAEADTNTLAHSVFMEHGFAHGIDPSHLCLTRSEIQIDKASPDKIVLSLKADGSGILVVANTYSPWWVCKVNGVDTEVIPAYHTFLGIPLDEGDSTVELQYDPPYWSPW